MPFPLLAAAIPAVAGAAGGAMAPAPLLSSVTSGPTNINVAPRILSLGEVTRAFGGPANTGGNGLYPVSFAFQQEPGSGVSIGVPAASYGFAGISMTTWIVIGGGLIAFLLWRKR